MKNLILSNNQISDLNPLAGLRVRYLYLSHNQITDLSGLAGLRVRSLDLSYNQITDLSPLVASLTIGTGDIVSLYSNPLSNEAINVQIPIPISRGVSVHYQ